MDGGFPVVAIEVQLVFDGRVRYRMIADTTSSAKANADFPCGESPFPQCRLNKVTKIFWSCHRSSSLKPFPHAGLYALTYGFQRDGEELIDSKITNTASRNTNTSIQSESVPALFYSKITNTGVSLLRIQHRHSRARAGVSRGMRKVTVTLRPDELELFERAASSARTTSHLDADRVKGTSVERMHRTAEARPRHRFRAPKSCALPNQSPR